MNEPASIRKAPSSADRIPLPSVGIAKNNLFYGEQHGLMWRITIWRLPDTKNALTTAVMQIGAWPSSPPFTRVWLQEHWRKRVLFLTAVSWIVRLRQIMRCSVSWKQRSRSWCRQLKHLFLRLRKQWSPYGLTWLFSAIKSAMLVLENTNYRKVWMCWSPIWSDMPYWYSRLKIRLKNGKRCLQKRKRHHFISLLLIMIWQKRLPNWQKIWKNWNPKRRCSSVHLIVVRILELLRSKRVLPLWRKIWSGWQSRKKNMLPSWRMP